MKKQIWMVAALLLGVSMETEARAYETSPAGATLTGWLAYRTTCQGGSMSSVAGTPLTAAEQPRLILTSSSGALSPIEATTDDVGQFVFEGVPAGDYRLQLEHMTLDSFWQNGVRESIPVFVTEGEFVSLGVVCENTTVPAGTPLQASWESDDAGQISPELEIDAEPAVDPLLVNDVSSPVTTLAATLELNDDTMENGLYLR